MHLIKSSYAPQWNDYLIVGGILELLKAAGATVVDVELPCVGEVDRAAILPTELLDFIGELLESFYV